STWATPRCWRLNRSTMGIGGKVGCNLEDGTPIKKADWYSVRLHQIALPHFVFRKCPLFYLPAVGAHIVPHHIAQITTAFCGLRVRPAPAHTRAWFGCHSVENTNRRTITNSLAIFRWAFVT